MGNWGGARDAGAWTESARGTSFPLLDLERLSVGLDSLADRYATARPFPHIVIDDFLEPILFERILEALPAGDQAMGRALRSATLPDGRVAQSGKRNYAEGEVAPLINLLFWQLNAGGFLYWLERLTRIRGLITDPLMKGGGVHVTDPGGLLRVHADFNRHPVYDLDRRINLLLYLNPEWRTEWGGDLQLWDRDVTECVECISPIGNRCVIFSTSSESFHGHPDPLRSPPGVSRKSIAMYYYSNGRPGAGNREKHATLWPDLPSELSSS